MRSFWSERFLWIHLAGLAVLPIALELCVLGLAVGDPILPVWLELLLVGSVGIIPALWMQWQRPFDIFSFLVVVIKPEQLTSSQNRILSLFKTKETRIGAVLAAVLSTAILWQLYKIAPIAAEVAPSPPGGRIIGLLVAAVAFAAANLFLQVPVSVLRVLLSSDTKLMTMEPYSVEKIRQDFTLLGFQVNQILPPLQAEPGQPSSVTVQGNQPSGSGTPTNSSSAQDDEWG
jgi:hypothetical protein